MRCRTAGYAFLGSISLFAYTGNARRLLAALKFEGRRRLAPWFADLVVSAMRGEGWGACLTPVPSRPHRGRQDAVQAVASAIEKRHALSLRRLLCRSGGAQQKTLDYEQRRANLAGRIHLRPGVTPDKVPSEVVLLDDVFTTGATLDACARALLQAGCRSVRAVTLVMEE